MQTATSSIEKITKRSSKNKWGGRIPKAFYESKSHFKRSSVYTERRAWRGLSKLFKLRERSWSVRGVFMMATIGRSSPSRWQISLELRKCGGLLTRTIDSTEMFPQKNIHVFLMHTTEYSTPFDEKWKTGCGSGGVSMTLTSLDTPSLPGLCVACISAPN